MTSTAHTLAAALLVTLLLAGCGGSSPDPTTTTAAVPTTPTTTSDATKPTTLTVTQQEHIQRVSRSFVSSVTRLVTALNGCVPARSRATCVRQATARAEPVVRRTRDTLSSLASEVGGTCATQVRDVRSKVSDVTDSLGPMAQATQEGRFSGASRLGTDVQTTLRSFASSSLIVGRAC